MPSSSQPPGRIIDPFFFIMLAAVLLALATSFILRQAAAGVGPSKVRAEIDTVFIPPHPPAKPHQAPSIPDN